MKKVQMEKKIRQWMTAAACFLLAACLYRSTPAEERLFYEDDVFMLVSLNEGQQALLDEEGNIVKILDWYIGPLGRSYQRFHREGVISADKEFQEGDQVTKQVEIFSLREKKTLMSLSAEDYAVSAFKGGFLTFNQNTRMITLYDLNGNMTGSFPVEKSGDTAYTGNIICYEWGGGYLLYMGYQAEHLYWYRKDTGEVRDLGEWLSRMPEGIHLVEPFGEYLYFGGYRVKGVITDSEGNILMTDIENAVREYVPDRFYLEGNMWESGPSYVVKREGTSLMIYDQNLLLVQVIPDYVGAEETNFTAPKKLGSFLTGVRYGELEGEVCKGFVEYFGKGDVPYAYRSGECLVSTEEETLILPLEEDETLVSLSDTYYLTETPKEMRIRKRDDGSVLQSVSERSEGDYSYRLDLVLSGSGFMMEEEEGEEPWETGIYLYNNEGKRTCRLNSSFSSGTGTCWSERRGIYNGFADINGNWVCRWTRFEE